MKKGLPHGGFLLSCDTPFHLPALAKYDIMQEEIQ